MTGAQAVKLALEKLERGEPFALSGARMRLLVFAPDHARLILDGMEIGFIVRGIEAHVRGFERESCAVDIHGYPHLGYSEKVRAAAASADASGKHSTPISDEEIAAELAPDPLADLV